MTAGRPLRRWLPLLAALAALPYLPSLRNGYLMDDRAGVVENAIATGAEPLSSAFARDFWGRDRAHGVGSYRPFATLAIVAPVRAGCGPAFAHLANIVLHVGCVLLLFAALRRLGVADEIAGVAACLFAVLAAPSEAILEIVGRADLLATLCVLLATLWHLEGRPVRASLALLAGLFCKESAISVLPVWLVLDLGRNRLRAHATAYAGYAAALAAAALARHAALGAWTGWSPDPIANPIAYVGAWQRLLAGLKAYGLALLLLVRPLDLSFDYSHNAFGLPLPVWEPLVLAGIAMILSSLLAVLLLRRRAPLVSGGLAWFVLTFLLVSNLVVFLPTVFGERLLYLPACGLCVAAAAGFARLRTRIRPAMAWGLLGTFVAIQGVLGARRALAWHDATSLYTSALGLASGSAKVQYNIACAYFDEQRFTEALPFARRASEIAPFWPAPHGLLGALFAIAGEREAAEGEFARGEALSRMLGRPDRMTRHNHSAFLWRLGRKDEAIALLRRTLAEDPDDAHAKELIRAFSR